MPNPFVISPAEPRDIPYLSTIQWAALLSNPLIQTLYPHGPTPALTAFTRDSYSKAITYPSVRLVKATDRERGEIVAFAKWIVYPEERDEEEEDEESLDEKTEADSLNEKRSAARSNSWVKVEGERSSRPEGVDERALRAWNEVMTRTRKGILGNRRHLCRSKTGECSLECYFGCFAPRLWVLDILHTHPSHQGRGAGRALVKWGTDLADKQRLQCYVEASPVGYQLFRKLEFHDVTEMDIDLSRYKSQYQDQEYRYKHTIMIRPPDLPPMVPPKDERRATVAPVHGADDGAGGLRVVNGDDADRSKSMGDTPSSERVGGWNFGLLDGRKSGLLDKSHFAGERESNYMEKRDTWNSEYVDSNRSSLI